MQPDPSSMDMFLHPDVQAKAPSPSASSPPPSSPLAAALRGLSILQLTLSVELGAGILAGVARAYFTSVARAHGGLATLSMTMSAVQLIFLGTAVAEIMALSALAAAPPASRVAELARPALVLRALSFVMLLISWALPYIRRQFFDSAQVLQSYMYSGYFDTVLHLVGTYLLVELLLRLRRFAAPDDAKVAESESLMRGGVMAALVARIIANYASYPLAFRFFDSGSEGQWMALVIRVPFALLFYGTLLWVVQVTITAVRSAAVNTGGDTLGATAAESATGADTSAAGYRNLLFGGLWAAGGIVVTMVTYLNARGLGGRYAVAYGAIFFGVVQFVRGLTQLGGRK